MGRKRAPQSCPPATPFCRGRTPFLAVLALGLGLWSCGGEGARPSAADATPGGADTLAGGAPEGPGGPETTTSRLQVITGVEVLLRDSLHLVRGLRAGLVTNHTGTDSRGVFTTDLLAESPHVELVALFSPEHGIRGTEEGGVEIEGGRDPVTGLPLHSLYGKTRKPTPEMLSGVEVLLFDIQDVGARYYTYVSTMALAMEAAGEEGIPFVVLDRPNPIDGLRVQGNVLDPDFSSFVGLYPVPMRHGMTVGELARLIRGEFGVEVELHVLPAKGWKRRMIFGETGIPWVPPSPNMPSVESALHYPGTCLFEGTNLSVGRGTGEAFQVVGAPWLDGEALAAALEARKLPGVRFEAVRFTPLQPGDGKFAGEAVRGVRLVSEDREVYDPTVTALHLLRETLAMSGDRWEWRIGHFDRLAGTDRLRLGLEEGRTVEELREGWHDALEDFRRTRAPYLLYPR